MTSCYTGILYLTLVVEHYIVLVLIIVHLMPTKRPWEKMTSLKFQMELMVGDITVSHDVM